MKPRRCDLLRDIEEAANAVAKQFARYGLGQGLTRITLSTNAGLFLGIAPGTTATIYTSAGPVELHIEPDLRYDYLYR